MNKPPLILLVDDEPMILRIYSLKLKQAGFDVVIGSNGAECIKLAKEKRPTLILLDIRMPSMNGLEAFAELRRDAATKDIKVVFLTSFSDLQLLPDTDSQLAKDVGADFIKKGGSLKEFVEEVRNILKGIGALKLNRKD